MKIDKDIQFTILIIFLLLILVVLIAYGVY